MSAIAGRLAGLGLELPRPKVQASANRASVVVVDRLAYVSGHGPAEDVTSHLRGKLGTDLTVDEGREAARACMLAILASLQASLGTLDRVVRVARITGYVNSAPDFVQQPAVIDAASDLLVELWGEAGVHARSAVGVVALPRGIPVEIEAIVEVEEPSRARTTTG